MLKNLFSKIKETYYHSRSWLLKKQIERYEKEDAEQEKLLKQIEDLRHKMEEKRNFKEQNYEKTVAKKEKLVEARFIRKSFENLDKTGVEGLSEVERTKMANKLKDAANKLEKNDKEEHQQHMNLSAISSNDASTQNKEIGKETRFTFMQKINALHEKINSLTEENKKLYGRLAEKKAEQEQRNELKKSNNQNSMADATAFAIGETLVVMQDPSNDSQKSFGGKLKGYLYDDNNEITHYVISDSQGRMNAVSRELENDTLVKVPDNMTLEDALKNIQVYLNNLNTERDTTIQSEPVKPTTNERVIPDVVEQKNDMPQEENLPDLSKIKDWQLNDYINAANLKNNKGLVPAETVLLFENQSDQKDVGVVLGTKENENNELVTAIQMVENLENGDSNIVYLTQKQMKNPNILIYEDQNKFLDPQNHTIDMEKLSSFQTQVQNSFSIGQDLIDNKEKEKTVFNRQEPILEMER